jgi:hypothetical protein
MKKFFILPIFLLIFSGCATGYNVISQIPRIGSTSQTVINSSNNLTISGVKASSTEIKPIQSPKETPAKTTSLIKQMQIQQSQNTKNTVAKGVPNPHDVCTPNWKCSDWNSCTNSQQTRTCTDLNSCDVSSPATSQSCISNPSPNTTFCNGVNYSACPVGQDFVCPASGSAHCQLPPVPKSNNQSCQDIFGANSMWSGQLNSQGGLICGCATGYVWNTSRTACQLQPAPESNDQICKNSYGANSIWSGQVDNQSKPLCTCATGYMSSSNGTTCIISDTCQKLLASYKQAQANEKSLEASTDKGMYGINQTGDSIQAKTGAQASLEAYAGAQLLTATEAVGQAQQILIQLNCPLQ